MEEAIEIANEQIKTRPNMFSEDKNRFGAFAIIDNELVYKDKYNDTPVKAKNFDKYDTSGICEGATNMMFLNHLKETILE